jgi:hypothetical protein
MTLKAEVYENSFDLSHMGTFGGKATMMDLSPCLIPGANHIIGDIISFNFAKKYDIQHVLFEELITSLDATTESFVEKCIQQLLKAMKAGAILEIKCEPFTEDLHDSFTEQIKERVTKDPFDGVINFHDFMVALTVMVGHKNPMTEKVREMSIKLWKHLQYFPNARASTEERTESRCCYFIF